jgi:hypothetical protein
LARFLWCAGGTVRCVVLGAVFTALLRRPLDVAAIRRRRGVRAVTACFAFGLRREPCWDALKKGIITYDSGGAPSEKSGGSDAANVPYPR